MPRLLSMSDEELARENERRVKKGLTPIIRAPDLHLVRHAPPRETAPPLPVPEPLPEIPPPRQAAPPQQVGGYYRCTNEVTDSLARTLDPYSQAVLQQLIRLAWGMHRETCHVGIQKLAERCGFSDKRVRKSKKALLARGLIEIVGEDNDNSNQELRGTTYQINLSAPPLRQGGAPHEGGAPRQTANKEKAFKEIHKKVSVCDRCRESPGLYYPEGIGKGGVRKCNHKI